MRGAALLLLAMAALPPAASAVDVQISLSAYDHAVASYVAKGQSAASPWLSATNEIRGAGGGAHLDASNIRRGLPLVAEFEADGATRKTGAFLSWRNRGDPMNATLTQGLAEEGAFSVGVALSGVVKCPAFGWVQAPYIDQRLEHGVLTMRGDPCSTVVNGTSRDLVVNGTLLEAGRGARLPFPFHLKMEEVPGLRFYDLATGAEFAPLAYTPDYTGEEVRYYDGAYSPMWTGDFMFTDGADDSAAQATTNLLVYADMDGGGTEGAPLHGAGGAPLYSGSVLVSTNVMLMTWWEFDHGQWGSSPKAIVNGEVVCDGHSTGHKIAHEVNAGSLFVSEMSGEGSVCFTMSLSPEAGCSGGRCVMRVWDRAADDYESAPAEHRAEASAGTGTARFRVTIGWFDGTWKVEAY